MVSAGAALAQMTLQSSTFGGGGGAATDGKSLMTGTLAQAIIGPVSNNTAMVGQGFWYTLPPLSASGVRYEPVVAGSAVVLHQNVPNPFSSTTEIAFDMPSGGYVSLKLYDVLGHEVRTLLDGVRNAGRITITASADELESGYYTARLVANGATRTITMVVVR
jgi:hypothetical protein